jgi:hypothetical protein
MCDLFMVEVGDGVGWLWWAKVAGVVGSLIVVMPDVGCEHLT